MALSPPLPPPDPLQAPMMMEAHAGWGKLVERRKALPWRNPPKLLTSVPSPRSSPGPGEGQCPTLCPTWSAAGLFSPLAPCRSPASSDSLSDLTSTKLLSLRASGFVLGEGGDNSETRLQHRSGGHGAGLSPGAPSLSPGAPSQAMLWSGARGGRRLWLRKSFRLPSPSLGRGPLAALPLRCPPHHPPVWAG